tara:strand:- start:172 stop:840 length:669 start_codon:yes stop_codon:yes gene_type:complete
MDIIEHLTSKPFVHIVATPRSGSTALYSALQRKKHHNEKNPQVNLSEPFRFHGVLDYSLVPALHHQITRNPEKFSVMKNLLSDINLFPKKYQKMLWSIPAYTVGLLRRNTFEQTISNQLHDLNADLTKATQLDVVVFQRKVADLLRDKMSMHKCNKLDEIIYYEDIVFPRHVNRDKNPPKNQTVSNLPELRQAYQETMLEMDQLKQVQYRGVTFNIDRSNKA